MSSAAKQRNISHTAGTLLVDSRSTHTSDCIQTPKPRRGSSGYGIWDGAKPGGQHSYRGSIPKFLSFGCCHLPKVIKRMTNFRLGKKSMKKVKSGPNKGQKELSYDESAASRLAEKASGDQTRKAGEA